MNFFKSLILLFCLSSWHVYAAHPDTGCAVTSDSKTFALAFCAAPLGCDVAASGAAGIFKSSTVNWLASSSCDRLVSKIHGSGYNLNDAAMSAFMSASDSLCKSQGEGLLAALVKGVGCVQSMTNKVVQAAKFEKCYDHFKSSCVGASDFGTTKKAKTISTKRTSTTRNTNAQTVIPSSLNWTRISGTSQTSYYDANSIYTENGIKRAIFKVNAGSGHTVKGHSYDEYFQTSSISCSKKTYVSLDGTWFNNGNVVHSFKNEKPFKIRKINLSTDAGKRAAAVCKSSAPKKKAKKKVEKRMWAMSKTPHTAVSTRANNADWYFAVKLKLNKYVLMICHRDDPIKWMTPMQRKSGDSVLIDLKVFGANNIHNPGGPKEYMFKFTPTKMTGKSKCIYSNFAGHDIEVLTDIRTGGLMEVEFYNYPIESTVNISLIGSKDAIRTALDDMLIAQAQRDI